MWIFKIDTSTHNTEWLTAFCIRPNKKNVNKCIQLTNLSDIGVLSPSGKCCSRASTIQLAMIVAKIMYSNGVGTRS